jgi:hypothetical protein
MSVANRLFARFGKTEVQHLSLLDQVFDRTRHFFDGHIRIDAVLVVKVDPVGTQTFERFFDHLFDVARSAI